MRQSSQMETKFKIHALGEPSPNLSRVIATSRQIELSPRLVDDDTNARGPPEAD